MMVHYKTVSYIILFKDKVESVVAKQKMFRLCRKMVHLIYTFLFVYNTFVVHF